MLSEILPSVSQGSESPRTQINEDATRVMYAEQEAQKKIALMQKRIENAARDTDQSLERITDQYEKRLANETSRQEMAIQSKQNKTYEALRKIQMDGEKKRRNEEQKIALEKEAFMTKVTTELDHIKTDKMREIIDTKMTHDAMLQSESQLADERLTTIRKQEALDTALMQEKFAQKMEKDKLDNEIQEKKMKSSFLGENQALQEKFIQVQTKLLQDEGQILKNIQKNANEKIESIQQDHATKIASYTSKADDPFYRLLEIDAKVYNEKDAFIIEAKIPPHEQKHLKITVSGDRVLLSGKRESHEEKNNQDILETSHSMQSFSSSFPLHWPVDAKKISRQTDGDKVIIHIPKKSYSFAAPGVNDSTSSRSDRSRF